MFDKAIISDYYCSKFQEMPVKYGDRQSCHLFDYTVNFCSHYLLTDKDNLIDIVQRTVLDAHLNFSGASTIDKCKRLRKGAIMFY